MQKILDVWSSCLFEHKDDINSAAGILLFNKNGQVLLSKRSENVNNPNTIGTIGGHLVKGEPPAIGAKREFKEEARFEGPFTNMELLYMQKKDDNFTYFTFIASTNQIDFNFSPHEEFAHEITWNKWLDFEKIKDHDNLHPGLKELFSIPYVVKKIRNFISEI